MNLLAFARVAKLVALFGFVLPWILVSCAGQPVLTASGLDLAVGSLNLHNPANGAIQHQQVQSDTWLVLAMLALGAGLVVSFVMNGRQALMAMLASSSLGLLFSLFGMQAAHDTHRLQQQPANAGLVQQFGDAAIASIQVQNQIGYYITLLGFLTAIGLSAYLLYGHDPRFTGLVRSFGGPSEPLVGDGDVAFWDGLTDKSDPDLLEEYLHRYPQGRFRDLAQSRLERLGRLQPTVGAAGAGADSQPDTADPQPGDPPSTACPTCNAQTFADDRFCGSCGQALVP